MGDPGTVVVAHHWGDPDSELCSVTRALAGAASRWSTVAVLAPGAPGAVVADGAFDVTGFGTPAAPSWPALAPGCAVVVDELTPATARMLAAARPRTVSYLVLAPGTAPDPSWTQVRVAGTGTAPGPDRLPATVTVPLYVPVNPMAAGQRHHGFGFVGYLLVLPGRPGTTGHGSEPPPAAAWLTAARHDAEVVVVADAVASVWKGRALRGRVSVDSRMDLWRLLAHASVCVDLGPGSHLARECVEALRFGTPVVVPDGSGVATEHAARGGGATFADPGELVAAVDALCAPGGGAAAASAGRAYADAVHGDAGAFVAQVGALLGFPPPGA